MILDQKSKYWCVECGEEIDFDFMYIKTKPLYCNKCRRIKRDGWKKGIKSTHREPKKGSSKFIMANLNWYNAGLVAGSGGYLRDKFYALLDVADDFLLVMEALRKDKKYLAEIADLTAHQRQVWLIGFFEGINKRVVSNGNILGRGIYRADVNNRL